MKRAIHADAVMHGVPSAERILTVLYDLYADQMGVKIEYEIQEGEKEDAGRQLQPMEAARRPRAGRA
jgi:hypothetical protein